MLIRADLKRPLSTLLFTLLLLAPAMSAAVPGAPWGSPGDHGPGALSPVKWRTARAPKEQPASKPATKQARGAGEQAQAQQAQQAQQRTASGMVAEGGACESDAVCATGTYCDRGTCVKVQRPFNALYLFYRSEDGRFTEAFGVYWHQKGVTGYQVIFPFYWNLWSPGQETRMVFPFFYSHQNTKEGTRNYFVTLFQYRATPNEKNYRLWPLVFWTDYGDRGAGLTILPLFHYAREGTRRSVVIPALLSGFNRDPEAGFSQGLLAGIYYWKRDGAFSADGVFPLVYHSRSPEQSFTWVLPFNFHWREGQERTLMILPFFYRRSRPESSTTISLVPPLYQHREGDHSRLFALPFFYHARDGDRTFFLGGPYYHRTHKRGYSWGVVPLFFGGRTTLTSYQVVFPVFWRFTAPSRNVTVAGPAFYYRRGHKTTAGLVPLALYHRDRKAGSTIGTVLPLFYYASSEHGKRSRLVSPLFLYERDDEAQVKHWGLVIPPYYHRRDADREVDTLFPLVMRWHDKIERSTTWVVGPVVYHDDPEGGTQVVLPLYWRFSDRKTGAATSVLFPIFYRHRRPDRSHFNLLFPFYYSGADDGWGAGILPIVFAGSSKVKRGTRRHAVVFPIFWHFSRPKTGSTTVLGSLYYRSKPTGWHFGAAPLLYAGNDAGDSYQVLFPAFWHLRSHKEGYDTWIAGPGFYYSGKKGRAFGVLPIFAAGSWKGARFTTVLPPLFYHSSKADTGESFTVAGPYIGWRERDKKGRDVRGHAIFPVAYYRRSAAKTVAFTVPLFYYRRDDKGSVLASPVGGFRRDSAKQSFTGVIGPYVWHRSPEVQGRALLPIFYHWTRPGQGARTTVILPFGVRHTSPQQNALVWFPLFWKFSSPKDSQLVIFPLYWRLREKGGLDADVAFPLLWRFRRPSEGKWLDVAGPFFSAGTKDSKMLGIFPLFIYRRGKEGSTMYALPFFYRKHEAKENKTTRLYGPFYWTSYDKGYALGVLPILYRKDTPDKQYTIVAPIYWDVREPRERKRLTFYGPFFTRSKGDERAVGLAPIFYASWDKTGGRTAAMVPLFYYRGEVGRSALYTPVFGWDRSPLVKQLYAGPYFRRHSDASALDIVFPLFVRHRDHIKGQTTMLIPTYYGRWSREQAFHLFFPLVWRHRRIDTTATVVFPFYWDFNSRYASRTSIFFPALLYHRDHAARSTSVFTPPGVWVRKRPGATDAVVFPLFWHFGGDKRSTTLGLPLYWDFKRGARRCTVLFPLFWRFDSAAERTTIVANTYLYQDKKKGTYNFLFIPLFQVQRKRPQDLKVEVLGGIWGYERVGRNRLMTIFFYTFPLEPDEGIAPATQPAPPGKGGAKAPRPPRSSSGPNPSKKPPGSSYFSRPRQW